MKIREAIALVNELKPNQVNDERKLEWLSRLDQRVYREIMRRHVPDEETPAQFSGYDMGTDQDTELLVKAPFDEIYRFYLEMQIDLVNLELDKYNNSMMLYNNAWGQYARAYHRTHRPMDRGEHHIF